MKTMAIAHCRLTEDEIAGRPHWAEFEGRSYLRVLAESLA